MKLFKWLRWPACPAVDFNKFPIEFRKHYRVLRVTTDTLIVYKIQWCDDHDERWHTVRYALNRDEWSSEEAAKRALYRRMDKHFQSVVVSEEPINI